VIHTSDAGHYVMLKDKKLLAKYTPAGVEGFPPASRTRTATTTGLRATVNAIFYNTKSMSAAEAPKTWKDLLDPKWKGKMVTAHPGYSGVIATHVLALVHLHGWEYFKAARRQQLMIVQSANDPSTVVSSRRARGGRNAATTAPTSSRRKATRSRSSIPRKACRSSCRRPRITAFARHPNAARLFTDFSSRARSSRLMADSEGLYTGHPEVKYPADKPKLNELKLLTVTPEELEKRNEEIKKRFVEFFGGVERGPIDRRLGRGRPRAGRLIALRSAGSRGSASAASMAPRSPLPRRLRRSRAAEGALNTVVLAFWVGLVSVAIGAPLAWLTARTDVRAAAHPGVVLASFVTPPFLGAFAWVMLAGPNAGILNTLWREATGAAEPLLNIFTMSGLVFVVSIYTFPYVYIMVANTLALIASDLEEAAAILGAGRLAVARTVTLPMVLPALASGSSSPCCRRSPCSARRDPGLAGGFHTVTTSDLVAVPVPAQGRAGPRPFRFRCCSRRRCCCSAETAARPARLRGRGGKGGQRRTIPLGPWRWPALAACLLVMSGAIFLPYGVLARALFPGRGRSRSAATISRSATSRSRSSSTAPRARPSSTRSSWPC